MKIVEIEPKTDSFILPGADFADAWSLRGLAAGENAETIAARIGQSAPKWVSALLVVRNAIVSPFGLKTRDSEGRQFNKPDFPILSARPSRVVLGLDDRHLDFRLVIDVEPHSRDQMAATATTYVRTHNRLGALYLAVIKPFHRIIVPALLRRAASAP